VRASELGAAGRALAERVHSFESLAQRLATATPEPSL
jgi:hypothetical protein